MNSDPFAGGNGPGGLAFLRQFTRPRSDQEHCDLCNLELAPEHSHLVEVASRRLICTCEPCAILFSSQAARKYRRVPRRVDGLNDFQLTELQWQALGLPIRLAFFLHSTAVGRVVAVYPSPGGATEADLPAGAWEELTTANAILRDLEPDVEALLVNRLGPIPVYYRVGVDECYRLVGLLRTHWRGFSGGAPVWEEIARFFASLQVRAGGTPHA